MNPHAAMSMIRELLNGAVTSIEVRLQQADKMEIENAQLRDKLATTPATNPPKE
jgi:hypothetical protein